jgi:hypothetical protein
VYKWTDSLIFYFTVKKSLDHQIFFIFFLLIKMYFALSCPNMYSILKNMHVHIIAQNLTEEMLYNYDVKKYNKQLKLLQKFKHIIHATLLNF